MLDGPASVIGSIAANVAGQSYFPLEVEYADMEPNRRALLKLAGATATVATLGSAGYVAVDAQETNDDGVNNDSANDDRENNGAEVTGELPAYSHWLTLDDGLEFTAVDWVALQEYVEGELEEAAADEDVPEEFAADPMIVLPSEGLLSVYFYVAFSLAPYRLGRLLEEGALATSVEGLLLANDVFVATGTIETDELDERLTADPGNGFFRQLERTAEVDGYDVYTPVEAESVTSVAVSSDAIVVAGARGEAVTTVEEAISQIETTIAAAAGDVERATDESEMVAWLVETAGHGDVVVGQFGERLDADTEFPALENAEGLVSSLSVVDEQTSEGEFAAEVVGEPDAAALEGVLGASADEQSVTVDGNRVSATATWREVE